MYSGRLDRSVYKQGQVVCPTVECTVEKGGDGSLLPDYLAKTQGLMKVYLSTVNPKPISYFADFSEDVQGQDLILGVFFLAEYTIKDNA